MNMTYKILKRGNVMAFERTLALIKPDAVAAKLEGEVLAMICKSELNIVAIKRVHLSKKEAALFYGVHSDQPFFGDLTSFISSGPLYAVALEGEDAIGTWRRLMGTTNPAEAAEGTIRACFGTALSRNVVHGSDCAVNAKIELPIFFNELEIVQ